MLLMADLATYVQGLVGSTPVVINRIPDSPDQMVMVAIAHGGKGFLVDGAFQQVVVHTRSRDVSDEGAETLALAVDAGLMNTTPQQMGAAYIRNAYPAAGPPCFFERDVENRTVYFCDYILEVSR